MCVVSYLLRWLFLPFWALCTHTQLNPFYHPFYPDVTHVRKDTRPSPRFSILIATKRWAGPGNKASTKAYFLKSPYWGKPHTSVAYRRAWYNRVVVTDHTRLSISCGLLFFHHVAIQVHYNMIIAPSFMLAFIITALDKANHLTAFFCMN